MQALCSLAFQQWLLPHWCDETSKRGLAARRTAGSHGAQACPRHVLTALPTQPSQRAPGYPEGTVGLEASSEIPGLAIDSNVKGRSVHAEKRSHGEAKWGWWPGSRWAMTPLRRGGLQRVPHVGRGPLEAPVLPQAGRGPCEGCSWRGAMSPSRGGGCLLRPHPWLAVIRVWLVGRQPWGHFVKTEGRRRSEHRDVGHS